MSDHIPPDLRDRMRIAAWLHQRETDPRKGAEIVRDALDAARFDLVNAIGERACCRGACG